MSHLLETTHLMIGRMYQTTKEPYNSSGLYIDFSFLEHRAPLHTVQTLRHSTILQRDWFWGLKYDYNFPEMTFKTAITLCVISLNIINNIQLFSQFPHRSITLQKTACDTHRQLATVANLTKYLRRIFGNLPSPRTKLTLQIIWDSGTHSCA